MESFAKLIASLERLIDAVKPFKLFLILLILLAIALIIHLFN